ncbi:MAG: hypothetical protein O9340_12465 [Cyclobacteriaceae bacterium]|jgi:hypothetical protein|nr:hypothetical protein [Cyclobacteriaceae bacterium]
MKRILLLFFLCYSIFSSGQSVYKSFLEDVKNNSEVLMLHQQIQYLDKKQYKLAPIQKLEFRTESNQLDPNRQEYALRINPANPWEMAAQNNYFAKLNEQLKLEKEIALEDALAERYLLIIDFAFTQALLIQKQKEIYLTKQWINILDKQTYSDYFDADRYFDLMIKEIELQDEYEELKSELTSIEKVNESHSNFPDSASIEHFLPINALQEKLEDVIFPESKIIQLKKLKEQAITSSIKLEKSNINIGYLQAQYQEFRIEQGRKPWNVGFGVTLPLFNPNKKNIAKRNLDLIESNLESDQDLLSQKEKVNQHYNSIKSLIERYNKIESNLTQMQSTKIKSLLVLSSDENPAIAIKVNLQVEKLNEIALELKQIIWEEYINWLKASNQLLTNSTQNVLLNESEKLELN